MSDDLVKRLRAAAKHPMMDNNCKADVFDVAEAADRIEELEAKLAKVAEGLHDLAKDFSKPSAGLTDFAECQHYMFLACRLRNKARATLAELKGQDDE